MSWWFNYKNQPLTIAVVDPCSETMNKPAWINWTNQGVPAGSLGMTGWPTNQPTHQPANGNQAPYQATTISDATLLLRGMEWFIFSKSNNFIPSYQLNIPLTKGFSPFKNCREFLATHSIFVGIYMSCPNPSSLGIGTRMISNSFRLYTKHVHIHARHLLIRISPSFLVAWLLVPPEETAIPKASTTLIRSDGPLLGIPASLPSKDTDANAQASLALQQQL